MARSKQKSLCANCANRAGHSVFLLMFYPFISVYVLFSLPNIGARLAHRHQTLRHVQWCPEFIKLGQKFGDPATKLIVSKNITIFLVKRSESNNMSIGKRRCNPQFIWCVGLVSTFALSVNFCTKLLSRLRLPLNSPVFLTRPQSRGLESLTAGLQSLRLASRLKPWLRTIHGLDKLRPLLHMSTKFGEL